MLVAHGRSYAEVAEELGIGQEAVRHYARESLYQLAGVVNTGLPEADAERLADHVLAQDDGDEVAALLAASEDARRLEHDLSAPLATFGADAEEEKATVRRPGISPWRRGLAAAILVTVAVAGTVTTLKVGGDGDSKEADGARTGTSTTSTGATTNARAEAQAQLEAPRNRRNATGSLSIVRSGSSQSLVLEGSGLSPTSDSRAYVLWVGRASGADVALGYLPAVGEDGRLQVQAAFSQELSVGEFNETFVTLERYEEEGQPSPSVPRGGASCRDD